MVSVPVRRPLPTSLPSGEACGVWIAVQGNHSDAELALSSIRLNRAGAPLRSAAPLGDAASASSTSRTTLLAEWR
jgi:hypothetical protein